MTAGIRAVAALVSCLLLGAAPGPASAAGSAPDAAQGAGPAAASPGALRWETRAVLTLAGAVVLTHGGHRTTEPVSDGFAETRRVAVLTEAGGLPTRLSVTYDAVHRKLTAPGVPVEARGRTFVVAAGARAGAPPRITEGGRKVKPWLAAEVFRDVRDLLAPDPFVAFAGAGHRAGKVAPVAPGVIERLLGLGAHTKVTRATLTLRRALRGRALLQLKVRLATRVGDTRVAGTLAGPVVVDTAGGRLSWLRLEGDLAGRGTVMLDLAGAAGAGTRAGGAAAPASRAGGVRKRPARPHRVRARAAVTVKVAFSLSRTYP